MGDMATKYRSVGLGSYHYLPTRGAVIKLFIWHYFPAGPAGYLVAGRAHGSHSIKMG